MDVRLVVQGGKNHGQAIPVRGPKFVIGPAEECQLRPGSDLVSRQHCVILMAEGYVAIRDFGSRNGTYVNGGSGSPRSMNSRRAIKSRLAHWSLKFSFR